MYLAFSYALTAPSFTLQPDQSAVSLYPPIYTCARTKKGGRREGGGQGEWRGGGGRGGGEEEEEGGKEGRRWTKQRDW